MILVIQPTKVGTTSLTRRTSRRATLVRTAKPGRTDRPVAVNPPGKEGENQAVKTRMPWAVRDWIKAGDVLASVTRVWTAVIGAT